ncbi:MAG: heme exporter protein CcmD [Thiobacillaceae bacterium]|nr:heme exporter protein CcmD [Thiobacillaceae bacterium]MCX7673860.1 heme exporter protein CcmD [Thiobacillaceae bacterium]MDW8324754.1 heme exporter protein CcmD [Burkholderiales bacterium]
MYWTSWSDFWTMGGYALYVWGSYAVTALVIVLEIILLRRGRQQTLQRLRRLQRWEEQ